MTLNIFQAPDRYAADFAQSLSSYLQNLKSNPIILPEDSFSKLTFSGAKPSIGSAVKLATILGWTLVSIMKSSYIFWLRIFLAL